MLLFVGAAGCCLWVLALWVLGLDGGTWMDENQVVAGCGCWVGGC